MTNEEFFENELKAVVKRVKEDLLIDQIVEAKKQWLKQEHVEQVDWSKVKVDTPILVRDYESEEWVRRYFAKFVDGKVYAWMGGATSWTADSEYRMNFWEYAKLAESEE